jgi:hypothetical protein
MPKKYSAIICEGAAEEAIIEILLENHYLIIENDEYLINNGPIRTRGAKEFCDKYMGKDYGSKIALFRILDSKREKFNLRTAKYRKIFEEKIEVTNVITPPEIELLIIVSEEKNEDFNRSGLSKPSEYCKQKLKLSNVKSYDFVKDYFSDVSKLLDAIKKVHSIKKPSIPKGFLTLYDLLKDEYQK